MNGGAVRILVLAALAAASVASAEGKKVAGAVLATVPMSARQMGMADASVGGDDLMRAWSNPALLGDLEGGEAALGGGSLNSGLTAFRLAGGMRTAPAWSFGGFLTSSGIQFDRVDGLGEKVGSANYAVTSLGAAGAYRWEWLTGGMTLKFIGESFSDLDEETSVGAMAFDIGVAARYAGFQAGLSVENMGPELAKSGNEPGSTVEYPGESLPTQSRLGLAYRYEPWRLTSALEVTMPAGSDEVVTGLGFDWWAARAFALRFGLSGQGSKGSPNITVGLTGIVKPVILDYALQMHPAGATNVIALSYAWGRSESAAEARREEPRREEPRKEEPVKEVPPPPAGSRRLNFAVSDLRGENVSAGDAAVIADLLRSELVRTGGFNVIEKQNMDKVLSEHAFQQTGCTTEECAVKLGKLLNVQRMAVGSFGKLLDSYFLNIRVVNVETGEVTFGDSVEGQTVSQLKTGIRDLAGRMARQVR